MNRFAPLLYTITGALLLWAAWPVSPFTFLIFVAWVPLLFLEAGATSWKKLLGFTYLHMVLWNVLTTWWVINASAAGASMAFLANSFLMCIPVMCFHFTKKLFGNRIGYASFILYWMAFEYLHMNWDLSWPWLTLGNVFATQTSLVQWYEFTGSSGGTLWVLVSSLVVFSFLNEYRNYGRSKNYFLQIGGWMLIIALPVIISISIKQKVNDQTSAIKNIVVVQPNIDPYEEKFTAGTQEAQLQKLIALSEKKIDNNTGLVVWPETAIPFQTDETQIKENLLLQPLWTFLKKYPQISLVTGVEGVRFFDKKNSPFSHPLPNDKSVFYEAYNSAAIFDSSSYSIYHKSRLVPGVEVLPSFLRFMDKIFESFGGTSGGYAKDTAAKVLTARNSSFKVAPAICYESVYGDYMTEFVRKGANVICIITNDGWWGNTPGYRQHMNYARLRAIETRTWVVRSANTGISCFIDPSGNVYDPQPWNTATSIKMDIPVSSEPTFFVKHGDILSRVVMVLALLLLVVNIIAWVMKRFFKKTFPGTVK